MMRVLWVHSFAPSTVSSGVFMFILAERLRQMGLHIDLHYTGPLRNMARIPRAAKEVANASSKYDLVHAQFGSACGLVGSYAQGPKVLTLRGTDMLGANTGSLLQRLHGRVVKRMTRRSVPTYDRVVVVSNRMRSDLHRLQWSNGPIAVVPSGVDLKKFQPQDRMEARRQLGMGDDTRPWVLFSSVTKGNHVKRPELATAAFELARQRRSDLVLQTLTGKSHDEVPLWINACDLVLLTSAREGWPNIIKESLACNVPFVSTDVSDLAGIAEQEASCVIADDRPAALANGIVSVLDRDRSPSLRSHVEAMDLDHAAQQLYEIYSEVLGQTQAKAA